MTTVITNGLEQAELQEYLTGIVQFSIDAIIGSSLDGMIKSWNTGAEKIFGYTAAEMLGKHISIAIPQKYMVEEATVIERIRSGESVEHYSTFGKRKDGVEFHISLTISPIRNKAGKVIGASKIARDTTSLYKLEAELKQKAEELAILKDAFLANMSHEIRTPLNAIIGFTDILLKKDLGEQEKDYAETIKNAGETLLTIINDILDTSKIEAGMMSFEERPLSIVEMFKSLHSMLGQKAAEKHLELHFMCDTDVPDVLMGDTTRLTQIIINLISNAIKFTRRGRVDVAAREVRKDPENSIIEFSVKDTGIGITEDKLQYIFERFRQAEAHTTRKYGGTGLGLSIVKNLVELQGGQMSVKSEINIGSEFSFTLSFKKTTGSHTQPKEELTYDLRALRKLNILLVEDNPLNIKLVSSLFTLNGLSLQVAENGIVGIEKLKAGNFDIVLMDMEMPVMNGYQATAMIRTELKNNVPIIAMTAHAMAGERERCLQYGMNDYISKPINANLLFSTIYNLTSPGLLAEEEPVVLPAETTIPGKICNLSYLIDATGENSEIINDIILVFLKQIPEELITLTAAIEKSNYRVINAVSHKLNSSVSIMGILILGPVLEEMERVAATGSGIERIKHLHRQVQTVFTKALEEIRAEKAKYSI